MLRNHCTVNHKCQRANPEIVVQPEPTTCNSENVMGGRMGKGGKENVSVFWDYILFLSSVWVLSTTLIEF